MIAVIPARGGSKGVKGKNVKFLNGKPLIAYTIEAALASTHISRVIVNTDDKEIASIAHELGAEIPFLRPDFLASDTARSIDVFKHTIITLEKNYEYDINELVILQPTSPLRCAKDIDAAIDIYKIKNADSVVSYCREHHPIAWHTFIKEDGRFESLTNVNLNNRQSFRPTYFPNGAIYILKKEMIFKEIYYSENSTPIG